MDCRTRVLGLRAVAVACVQWQCAWLVCGRKLGQMRATCGNRRQCCSHAAFVGCTVCSDSGYASLKAERRVRWLEHTVLRFDVGDHQWWTTWVDGGCDLSNECAGPNAIVFVLHDRDMAAPGLCMCAYSGPQGLVLV